MKKLSLLVALLVIFGGASLILVSCGGGGGGGGDSQPSSPSTPTSPLTPKSLTANAGDGAVSLKWDAAGEETSYKVYMTTEPFGGRDKSEYSSLTGFVSYDAAVTSHDVSGLVNGTTYYFVATAIKDGQESNPSNEDSATPEAGLPNRPRNLTANAGDGNVNLNWEAAEAGVSYKVYVATESFGDNPVSAYSSLAGYTGFTTADTSYEVTGLSNSTNYYFVVTAIKDGKESVASNEIAILPDTGKPQPPTSLTANAGDGKVTLSWTETETGVTYKVHRAKQSFESVSKANYNSLDGYTGFTTDGTSYEVTGLTNGTTYYFVVTAIKDNNESEPGNTVSATPDYDLPQTPTSLTANAGDGKVTLSWTETETGVTYKVHRAKQSFESVSKANYNSLDGYTGFTTDGTSYEVTGLTNGATYYFVVTAIKDNNESEPGNTVSATPDYDLPQTPTSLTGTAGDTVVNLSWTATGETGVTYKLHQATIPFGATVPSNFSSLAGYKVYDNISTTSHQATGLTNGATYYFVVTAYNGKDSGASNQVSANPELDTDNDGIPDTTDPDANGDGIIDTVHIYSTRRAFAALKKDGTVVTWGEGGYGGDSSGVSSNLTDVTKIYSTWRAFAAVKKDGTVVTWGHDGHGGNSSGVSSSLTNVAEIFSVPTENGGAFAALKKDGTVVTWGDGRYGGNSSAVSSRLTNVDKIFSTATAFAALKKDGTVVTWGHGSSGGDSSGVSSRLTDVAEIFSSPGAFAAVKNNGEVVVWGHDDYGGDSSAVSSSLTDVAEIFSAVQAFAALKRDGTVVTWGHDNYGGDSSGVSLTNVATIFSTVGAFAALKTDGAVATWGHNDYGGNSDSVSNGLTNVDKIFSTARAFAALKQDGTVVTWGPGEYGGDSSAVSSRLTNVDKIFSTEGAFAAVKKDGGTVVTWGPGVHGGNSDSVSSMLTNVDKISSTSALRGGGAFAALKRDGTVVTWGEGRYGGDSSSVENQLR